MKNFVQNGVTITVTAVETMVSGKAYLVGSIRGVAAHSAAIGEPCELVTEGVFELAKTAADAPDQGDIAYLDTTAGEVTTTSTDNYALGIFIEAQVNGDTTGKVRLIQDMSGAAA